MVYHVSRFSILLGEHKLKHKFPFCFCQSAINTVQFTGRTGALSSLVAGVGSASGGFITGHLLDRKNLSRRKCGIVGLVFVSAIMWITWIGGGVNQTKVLGRFINSCFRHTN
jgi:predicted MFS family arabinose efflux permease